MVCWLEHVLESLMNRGRTKQGSLGGFGGPISALLWPARREQFLELAARETGSQVRAIKQQLIAAAAA